MSKKTKGRLGSSFDDFLKENAIYEEVTARAIKRVIVRQLGVLTEKDVREVTRQIQMPLRIVLGHTRVRRLDGGVQLHERIPLRRT